MTIISDEEIDKIVKHREIFFIFEDFNMEFGGLTGAVLKRANYLAEHGYKINLLSVDQIQNFDYICDKFQNTNILSKNINFVNVYDYYSKKNTITHKYTSLNPNLDKENYYIKKVSNTDNSITLNYFNDSILIKSEIYIDNILVFRIFPDKKEYFTKDGFRYLVISQKNNGEIFELYERDSKDKKEFLGINEFLYYFMDELCSVEDKPFLVCDSTSHYYNMNGVKNDVYKIGVMHGNPYVLDTNLIDYISPRINHLQHLDDLETLVVLTNSVKNDLINEFKEDKFTVIPNFISDELLKTSIQHTKNVNKIAIFSRISPEKQIADAITAFKIVLDVKPNAILEIYGRAITDNEKLELKKLEKLVKELNVEDNVLFKGYLEDVNEKMQKSLCTLLTSRYEGLPLSILESMANATPVISYDLKYGPEDVITNGVDGIIIEMGNINQLADEIIKILDNPQIAIELGINAREKIKNNFSTSSVCYKWEELFRNVFITSKLNNLNQISEDIKKLKKENKKLKIKNKKLNKMNKSIINSKSWKLTAPLRKITRFIKKIL